MYDEIVDEINKRINYKFMQPIENKEDRFYLIFFILFFLLTFLLVKSSPKYLRKNKDDANTVVYWKVLVVSATLSGILSVIIAKYLL